MEYTEGEQSITGLRQAGTGCCNGTAQLSVQQVSYCDPHPVRVCENRRILRAEMEFSKHAYMLKDLALSRN